MKYATKVLGNGLRLAMITGLSTKAVTVAVFIRAGFRFEPFDKAGLAHFVEHVVFSGTKSFPSYREEAEAVERYGGWHMAYTWIEEQKHLVHIPIDYFNQGVDVLLESIFAPLVEGSEIEKEKGVIKEEILKNKSDPAMAIWNYVWSPLFFQGTPLARPYHGDIKDIANISQKDILNFIKNNFMPQKTVLFVAGDFKDSVIKKVIEGKLKNLQTDMHADVNFTLSSVKPIRKKRIFIYEDPSYYKTSIMIGVETVPFANHQRHGLNILREMLGGYFGATLVRRLRDEGGLIYAWETFQENIADTGYLVFHASTAHENVYKVIHVILDEFQRLSKGEFVDEEFDIAKGHLSGGILANIEKGQDYIEWYGMQELLNPENVLGIEEQISIYKKISMEEVKMLANKYLSKENILVGVLGRAKEHRLEKLLK